MTIEETSVPRRIFSSEEKKEWMQKIFRIYEEMKKKGENGPYEINFGGLNFKAHPTVYAPPFFTDSLWFSKELSAIVGQKFLLEIGTGMGVIGISCALNGARVVLTDINPDAVKIARENAEIHKVKAEVREGDLYSPIRNDEKFDFIFWAHPYNNWDSPVEDILLRTGLDYNYEGLKGYIEGAKKHLTPTGKLLLGTGDTADIETITSVAKKNGYSIKVLTKAKMPLDVGEKGEITNMILQFDSL
jgi:release factor glutamine methyltransferase